MWKLNHIFLSNLWVKEEFTGEFKNIEKQTTLKHSPDTKKHKDFCGSKVTVNRMQRESTECKEKARL